MAIALACALLPLCPAFAADPPLPVDGDVPVTLPRVDVRGKLFPSNAAQDIALAR
jgi:hypothetical protein